MDPLSTDDKHRTVTNRFLHKYFHLESTPNVKCNISCPKKESNLITNS